jgi:hypothetical protein
MPTSMVDSLNPSGTTENTLSPELLRKMDAYSSFAGTWTRDPQLRCRRLVV